MQPTTTQPSGGLRLLVRTLRRDKKARRAFLTAALVPVLFVFGLTVAGPFARLFFAAQSGAGLAARQIEADPALRADLSRAAFLEARLALAASGAVSLSLDLPDSTLTIELNGVPLRTCRLVASSVSRTLTHPRLREPAAAFEVPFQLRAEAATLPKAPIRVIEAPADTAEARSRTLREIPVEDGPVRFKLWFDRSLTLAVDEAPGASGDGRARRLLERESFESRVRLRRVLASFGDVAQQGVPVPERWIRLELSPADAKAVYRALDADARLALRL